MQSPKTFRPWQPGQTSLLPQSPFDWPSADHQAYFLLDLVDGLDLSGDPDPCSGQGSSQGERVLT